MIDGRRSLLEQEADLVLGADEACLCPRAQKELSCVAAMERGERREKKLEEEVANEFAAFRGKLY